MMLGMKVAILAHTGWTAALLLLYWRIVFRLLDGICPNTGLCL